MIQKPNIHFLAPYMLIVCVNGSNNFDWVLESMGVLSVQCSGVQRSEVRGREIKSAKDCKSISDEDHHRMSNECREVGTMFGSMIKNPTPFLIREI